MLLANDMWTSIGNYPDMARNPRSSRVAAVRAFEERRAREPDIENDTLYLKAWLKALGVRQGKLAAAIETNEGYISQLCRGTKTNPSRELLVKIGRELEIDWRLLFESPPSKDTPLSELSRFDAVLIDRLSKNAAEPLRGRRGHTIPPK